MKDRLTLTAALGLTLVSVGCTADSFCEELSACGGAVIGTNDSDADGVPDTTWSMVENCKDPLHAQPPNAALLTQPTNVAKQPPLEPTTSEWCQGLIFNQDGSIKQVLPWFPSIPLTTGSLKLTGENKYNVSLSYNSVQQADFSSFCLTSQGKQGLTCQNTNADLSFTERLKTALAPEPNIQDVVCVDAPDDPGGCQCFYNMLIVAGQDGLYSVEGDMITFYDRLGAPRSEATYCVQGDSLEITSVQQTWLFNQPALKTMAFGRAQ
jgi:hypothetical protein